MRSLLARLNSIVERFRWSQSRYALLRFLKAPSKRRGLERGRRVSAGAAVEALIAPPYSRPMIPLATLQNVRLVPLHLTHDEERADATAITAATMLLIKLMDTGRKGRDSRRADWGAARFAAEE